MQFTAGKNKLLKFLKWFRSIYHKPLALHSLIVWAYYLNVAQCINLLNIIKPEMWHSHCRSVNIFYWYWKLFWKFDRVNWRKQVLRIISYVFLYLKDLIYSQGLFNNLINLWIYWWLIHIFFNISRDISYLPTSLFQEKVLSSELKGCWGSSLSQQIILLPVLTLSLLRFDSILIFGVMSTLKHSHNCHQVYEWLINVLHITYDELYTFKPFRSE